MKKVVINACYGGFSLSHEAVIRYLDIKGITVYPEQGTDYWKFWTYWLVKPEDRNEIKAGEDFYDLTIEDRRLYNIAMSNQTFYERDIERHDPALVQTVEELGERADGDHAQLKIVEIPHDVQYQIEDYDGNEWVAEVHRTWS
jgi:hypothetical protein